ncbi:MAG: peptide chain release factor-like protein [Planctomycetota bacterium]|nr:peptide chain release factor-like protein [Planctomycetota bacterium]
MITSGKWESLRKKMENLGIKESDLEEKFIRSGGHGGQNVNKVSSCVQLTHLPTGISVKCQVARSQGENRFHARKILMEKVEEEKLGVKSARAKRIHRIRAQKRKRSRRAKEKMLGDKKKRSEKKEKRKDPRPE